MSVLNDDDDDFSRRSEIYKRGYVFRRGSLVIQVFQQETVSGTRVYAFDIQNVVDLFLGGFCSKIDLLNMIPCGRSKSKRLRLLATHRNLLSVNQ